MRRGNDLLLGQDFAAGRPGPRRGNYLLLLLLLLLLLSAGNLLIAAGGWVDQWLFLLWLRGKFGGGFRNGIDGGLLLHLLFGFRFGPHQESKQAREQECAGARQA